MTSQTTFTSCMHDKMLESNRDDVKLEAMRCVTVMTAKGKLSVPRSLFPHIIKNVSSKNPELKKLIYLYLTNFADQEPDLALLPVATLQKSLKNPNPLIRSSALKVLTSMRLNILSAILMATLRNSVNDLSPYVRKTVAHSIIKIHRLDSSLKPDLVEYIERLFNDKNSMVLSSVVAAYEAVCPERLDLVQKHYKRFCFILADCNEWGQVLMLKLLVRYILETYKPAKGSRTKGSVDQDPKILLRSAKPLVHSNNSAVVMAVVRLFIAIANHNEVRSTITRPLIRLLYSHREIKLVVLNMIEDLTKLTDSSMAATEVDSEGERVEDEDDGRVEVDKIVDAGFDNHNELETVPEAPSPIKAVDNGYDNIDGHDVAEAISEDADTSHDKHGEADIEAGIQDGAKVVGEEDNRVENLGEVDDEDKDEHEDVDEGDDEAESGSGSEEEESEEDEEEEEEEEDEEEDEEDDEDEGENKDNECKDSDENIADIEKNHIDLEANKDPIAYREIFRPYIKSFFVKHTDCTQIRLVKLKILTNLSSSVNVSQILKELQAYIAIYVDDREFVSASIHAIGRCAMIVKEVAHTCLNGLTTLLSNSNEHIVSEAIVVLRSQIINKKISGVIKPNESNNQPNGQKKESETNQATIGSQSDEDDKMVSAVIKQVAKLMPTVTAPQARATILWILAEFCDKNLTAAKCTPNILRLIAKSFCQEDNFVKLQSLTLASKFLLSLDKEKKADLHNKIRLIASYLFSLAKYDINHDVRDRGRFLKKLLENEEVCVKVLSATGYQKVPELAA